MSAKLHLLIVLAGWLLTIPACTTPSDVTPDPAKPRKGVVSGRALDAQGKPLANATIVINNTQYYNYNILGKTDANGAYSLALTAGSWYVRGTVSRQFDNKTYTLDLHPDDDRPFAGTDGAVRNLTLKIAGKRTGQFGNDGHYGGQVEVYTWGLDTEQVTLTLQPQGTLLDGSVGKAITARPEGMYLDDVPLGKYTLTARMRNRPLRVRVRNTGQDYATSLTASFDPAYAGAQGRYKLAIEVSE